MGEDRGNREQTARRRVKKFLARSERALSGPIKELREVSGNGKDLGINIEWTRESPDGEYYLSKFELPALDPRILDSVIVDCRVFFAMQEDCYLPSVVAALRQLVGAERSVARKPLASYVGQVVRDGRLVAPISYAGRLESDNGLGPNRLLGDDQIAMDYVYGMALHEDDERLARLENVSDLDSVRHGVLLQMNQLLHVVENVRAQVVNDLEKGYFSLDDSSTEASRD